MSSPDYVTQNEYPLDDDTTLMSTTDLHSYMTHTNDTFVQVSGFTLQELLGQPHNIVRHPDMPKAAFADMWYTLQKGEPWSGIVKNRRKNGDHYWVRANAVPMVRNGQMTGYMSIRTRATEDEVAAVEPLYKALNEGRSKKRIHKGLVVRKGWLGKLPAMPLRWRVRSVMAVLFAVMAATLVASAAGWASLVAAAVVMLLGTLVFEQQIVRPVENVARQALRVATGERNSVQHLNRSDEMGLTLRAVGQLGLMCRWLINDVSSQVVSVVQTVAPRNTIIRAYQKGAPVSSLEGPELVNGVPSTYRAVYTGRATGYTASRGRGASGLGLYYGTVAVNPNQIPYGSKLYITSTDGRLVYGYAIATDTGGAMLNGSVLVDLFMETYYEAAAVGAMQVNVYVI